MSDCFALFTKMVLNFVCRILCILYTGNIDSLYSSLVHAHWVVLCTCAVMYCGFVGRCICTTCCYIHWESRCSRSFKVGMESKVEKMAAKVNWLKLAKHIKFAVYVPLPTYFESTNFQEAKRLERSTACRRENENFPDMLSLFIPCCHCG